MAVTMTAELADCFDTKREGVAFVLDAFRTAFPETLPWVYGVDGRFRSAERPGAARSWSRRPTGVASATLVARTFPDALFLDVGSTTTDVIPIVPGRVAARGQTDPGRLRTGELIYTGALRTPVCAIVRSVPLGNRRCRVAAEHFAIAADVHRWLRRIDDGGYTCETPDGRGPEPHRGRCTAGANGVRRSRDANAGRHHGHRGARGAGAGAADRRRHPAGDAAPGLGRSRAGGSGGAGSFMARGRGRGCRPGDRELAEEIGAPLPARRPPPRSHFCWQRWTNSRAAGRALSGPAVGGPG